MKGKIGLSDLAIECIIGCAERERESSQKIFVDITLELEFGKDALEDTVDYIVVGQVVEKLAIEGQFYLLETLVSTSCDLIIQEFRHVQTVSVRVRKPHPVPHVGYSFAECQKSRD